jgi:hypothetical protein
MLAATRESLREHMATIATLRARLTQMEAALAAVVAWRNGPEGPDMLFSDGAEMMHKVKAALTSEGT